MRIEFHGAAGEVTGSCHLVEAAGYRILLDCGLIQGREEDERRNAEPFPFEPAGLDAVVLSHAHIDHAGRLPLLVQRGFRGPIWTHRATADLLAIMLADAASLAEQDAERENRHRPRGAPQARPLYTQRDVAHTLKQVRLLDYDVPHAIADGVDVLLRDAGHILGSASVTLMAEGRTLLFSGDQGVPGTPILRDPVKVPAADLVLLESTYGDRAHRTRSATLEEVEEILDIAHHDGGNVLIPAFAVGRTQEILYWFARNYDAWKLDRWSIFLDSPMAVKVLDVYNRHEALFDREAQRVWNGHPHPFQLPNLRLTTEPEDSQAINDIRGGAIIIAGSGMCNGGRIRHHLRHNLGRRNAHVVFVGYQAQGTLGRRLVDGAPSVRIFGEEIQVNAQRHTVGGLSAHADQPTLLDWYGAVEGHPPVVLVHGEDRARVPLAEQLQARFGCDVALATPGMARTL